MLIRYSIIGGLFLSAATWLAASARPAGTAAGAQGRAPATASGDINYSQMTREIEAFRRLLVERISEKPSPNDTPSTIFYAGSLLGGNADAYYVAGVGAVFVARTDTVLIGPASASTDNKESGEPSEWDRALAEVDGKSVGGRSRDWAFDATAVDNLKNRVLTLMGDFGSKIGQLGEGERVVVVLRSSQDVFRVGRNKGLSNPNSAPEAVAANPKGDTPAVAWTNYSDLASLAGAGGRAILTMSALHGDCAAVADKKLGIDDFKKRAKIAQYFQPNSSTFATTLHPR
jgi:hypothetical protein